MHGESEQSPADDDRRTLVVGYNGRPHGRQALAWAAAEAGRRDVPLLVVYAANYPGMTLAPGPGLLDFDPGALDAAKEVTDRGVAEALAAQPGLRVTGATEVTGPVQALTEAEGAALLVIGTRGHGPVVGALLGSVAFAVAARAKCPVIVVKSDAGSRPHGGGIVAGTDGSEGAAFAVTFAADRAAATAQALKLVTCTGERPSAGISQERLRNNAQQIADTTRAMLARTHPQVAVTTRVDEGPAERALIDASTTADLVAVGTRGRGAFRGMLLGSVSHALIHGALCPVAIVGPGQPAEATVAEPAGHERSAPSGRRRSGVETTALDLVEIWGLGSFPASDPPANW